jgi:hypothetical protein
MVQKCEGQMLNSVRDRVPRLCYALPVDGSAKESAEGALREREFI